MKLKRILRLISLVMLIIAVVFLAFALTHPEYGTVFYIGNLKIGSSILRGFYALYAIVTVALFGASFLVKKQG